MQAILPEPPAPQTPAEPEIELSIVMPCLNEARTVGACVTKAVEALQRLGIRGEVIVADNGSTDGSQEIATSKGARVVHASRRGYGSALQAGIAAARGTYVIMGDADESYDFGNIEPFLARLRAGDELVMGNRFRGGIKPGAMPWLHRYIGNPVLTGILNLFFRTPIGDAHCGQRGFRKDAYERLGLTTQGMEFASEMVVKAALYKQKMSEVPVFLYPDKRDRPPHLRSFRDGWRHLRFLLLFCPLWLYLIPAGFLMTVGLGLMAWLTPGPQMISGVTFDLHTMLMGTLFLVIGYQILWMWAFAKIHGWTSGLLPSETFSLKVFKYVNLERGLLVGLGLLAAGLGFTFWLFAEWWGRNMGPLELQSTMRWALWGFTGIVLGVQTIFGSFFVSMLGMSPKVQEAREARARARAAKAA
jgi:glycosyltransferase involved in cell wall biosynthesis